MAEKRPPGPCPICGQGTWIDVAFDANGNSADLKQDTSSRQVETYSCGHELTGPTLASDSDEMVVEARTSQDTVDRGQ